MSDPDTSLAVEEVRTWQNLEGCANIEARTGWLFAPNWTGLLNARVQRATRDCTVCVERKVELKSAVRRESSNKDHSVFSGLATTIQSRGESKFKNKLSCLSIFNSFPIRPSHLHVLWFHNKTNGLWIFHQQKNHWSRKCFQSITTRRIWQSPSLIESS